MKPSNPSEHPVVVDRHGNTVSPKSGSAAMDLLALGAGLALLLSAGKSRSAIGGLIKGSAATALLGKAAKNTGALGKVAGVLSGSSRKSRIRR